MKRKIVILGPKHDGTPRTKGPELKDEIEFQELSRMIEAGEVDRTRTIKHLAKKAPRP